jgi:hypothetical protein
MKKIEELIAEIETKYACVSLHSIGEGCYKTAFISYINRRNAGRNNFFTLEIPMDIQAWWDTVLRGTLFCDIEFGQWGLQILSEQEAFNETHACLEKKPDKFKRTDVILGIFLGDLGLLLIDCEPGPNFGSVYIALPADIGGRKKWPKIANTFTDFLERYVEGFGNKYWEV